MSPPNLKLSYIIQYFLFVKFILDFFSISKYNRLNFKMGGKR